MSRLCALVVCLAGTVALLMAQDQTPRPTFRIDANYVRVDVYPTRDGRPVTDLTAADFEVFEDNAPQAIEQFQRVVARNGGGPVETRREPNTVAESRQLAQTSEARVFVLFLDPNHVELAASRNIAKPLANALSRLVGPDDLIGVMMPGMSTRDITFSPRTAAIENMLARDWWGRRDRILGDDPRESAWAACYPGVPKSVGTPAADRGIAQEMILRSREQQTLDALEELVVYLRGLREERKTVLSITDGWLLYGPNPALMRPVDSMPPPTPPVGFNPGTGRLTQGDGLMQTCERDRLALSQIDHDARLRAIVDQANRSNTSVYPIDPRGLPAFDENIVPAAGVGAGPGANPTLTGQQESARLAARATALRRLAEGTDGFALVGTNDLAAGLRRITDDLQAYYLLGYYSTGKLDGRFHSITVRVKRPGVAVRARRGYQALRASDLTTARPVSADVGAAADRVVAAAVSSALTTLTDSGRDTALRAHVTAGWRTDADGGQRPAFWTVGEIADRAAGAEVQALLTTSSGEMVTSARGQIVAGASSVLLKLTPSPDLAPGDYMVRVRSQGAQGADIITLPVTLPPPGVIAGAVYLRRGPTTANREVPTADRRFRRTERLRVDLPALLAPTAAQLLDRTGKALAIPVAFGTRTDADGTAWATGELALAPLAPGDYLIDFAFGQTKALVAFRVVP